MVKLVLENVPVYWISLCKIPKSILHAIRCRVLNFLFSGSRDKSKFHLVWWDSVARPKEIGGWVIKNIEIFCKALAASDNVEIHTKYRLSLG